MRKQITFSACVVALITLTTIAQAQESDIANADGNSDGEVTLAEFTEYVESRLPGFVQIDAFVKRVDADDNGEISEDEFDGRFEILQELQNEPAQRPMKQQSKSDDKKQSGKNSANTDTASSAYNDIKKLILASKWKEASEHMTKHAQDELCAEQITKAIGLLQSDLPMQLPGFDEVLEDLEDAFDKHELDDIDIKVGKPFKMKWNMRSSDGDDEAVEEKKHSADDKKAEQDKAKNEIEQTRKTQHANHKKIIEALDKHGKRWEIISDVWQAQKKSPFAVNTLTGNIEQQAVDGDKALLTVKMVPPPRDDEPGVMMKIVSPPIVVQMHKVDGKWKYAGRDQQRTEKAMEEFMKNRPRQFGGSPERSDF